MSEEFDFSDEGEAANDPHQVLLVQTIGGKGAGKTTNTAALGKGKRVVFISFDGATKPIVDKLKAQNYFEAAWTKRGDRQMWIKDGQTVRYVADKLIPKRAARNHEYLMALLDTRHYGDQRPHGIMFDDAAAMEKLCEMVARSEAGAGPFQPMGKGNFAFWGKRNQLLRNILDKATSLATEWVGFATDYEFDASENRPEPDNIKGEWTRKADIVFHALNKRSKLSRKGAEIEMQHHMEVNSSKYDDIIVRTGRVFDMHTDEFEKHFSAYFAKVNG